jgi:16S rRNA (cytosine967-C5)-methyltransferase
VSGEKPREIAVRVLLRRRNTRFIEDLLDETLAKAPLAPADRRLCQELVYGTVRWQATLDWLVARKTKGRTQKALLQNLLRLGLYQIFWLERIPNHAAVNESVELAKHNGLGVQAGFVNAVLRGYLREFESTKELLAELKTSQPALGYSHPEWLVKRWEERYGAGQTAQLLEWNNSPPPIFARVNTLKGDASRVLSQWREENVEYDFIHRDWLEENLVFEMKRHPPLTQLPSFQQGLFYIQDPSTLLAVRGLDPRPGESVLDLCAAPGGKLSYIAQLMRDEGRLIACDTSVERLKLIRENCTRLGIKCVQPLLVSPLEGQSSPKGPRSGPPSPGSTLQDLSSAIPKQFDRIMVDAPCSNTGVMRRRVDLRWRIRPEEIDRLREVQLSLLRLGGTLLKPAGRLVYSTCSLEAEENEGIVNEFLKGEMDFELPQTREVLPFKDRADGAYVARFEYRK